MDALPRDIALDIFSRLPITSLVHIKCVCRAWRAIAKDPRLVYLYDARTNERNPCLILQTNKSLYFFSDGDDTNLIYNSKARRIREKFKIVKKGYLIEGSSNGLLCVCDAKHFDPKYVINPFTSELIELPVPNQYQNQEIAFGFGYHSTTREYKIVRVAHFYADLGSSSVGWSDVQILSLGSEAWTSIGRCPCLLDYGSSEAFVNESFHWSMRRYNDLSRWVWIISFDLDLEEFNEIPAPPCESHYDFSMLVVDGCLSVAVHFDDGRVEIWVMREYNVKESWSKQFVIPSYLSVFTNQNSNLASSVWGWPRVKKGPTQVLCMLKNGEILLKYYNKHVVLYDPQSENFKDIKIEGVPDQQFITTLLFVSLSPFKMVGIEDSKSRGKHWPPEAEETFMRLMTEEIAKRTMQKFYFHEETWEALDDKLFKRLGRRYTVPTLKSKFNQSRQKYRAFAELLKHTKFRWDPETNKVTADGDFWKKYLRMHSNGKVFMKEGYKCYKLLAALLDKSIPVGSLSRTMREPSPSPFGRYNTDIDCWCSRIV